MKHFSIAYNDSDDNFCEIFDYAEILDEEIKNAINNILISKYYNYIFRCSYKRHIEWLFKMESFIKKEYYKDSLMKKRSFIIKEIKNHINNLLQRLKSFLKIHCIFNYSF